MECFDVEIVNDVLDESNEEVFPLELSAGTLTDVGTPGTADVTILDDERKS